MLPSQAGQVDHYRPTGEAVKIQNNPPRSTPFNAGLPPPEDLPVTETESDEPTIRLDHFLQTCGVATGGQAKRLIQAGQVLVNDQVETRRRKKLSPGDEVTLEGEVFIVCQA